MCVPARGCSPRYYSSSPTSPTLIHPAHDERGSHSRPSLPLPLPLRPTQSVPVVPVLSVHLPACLSVWSVCWSVLHTRPNNNLHQSCPPRAACPPLPTARSLPSSLPAAQQCPARAACVCLCLPVLPGAPHQQVGIPRAREGREVQRWSRGVCPLAAPTSHNPGWERARLASVSQHPVLYPVAAPAQSPVPVPRPSRRA